MRNFQRIGGGRGLRGGPGKSVDGVFPVRAYSSSRHQRRLVVDSSPGRGRMAQDGGTRGGTFHGEMDRCIESQDLTTAFNSMPENDGRTKERIAQSKQARDGSPAIVD